MAFTPGGRGGGMRGGRGGGRGKDSFFAHFCFAPVFGAGIDVYIATAFRPKSIMGSPDSE